MLPAPLVRIVAGKLRHMVLTRWRVPMPDPQPLIQRRQPLPRAARVVGARHRQHAIQAVHRPRPIPVEAVHHVVADHLPPLVSPAQFAHQALHRCSPEAHQALQHCQFQTQHRACSRSGTSATIAVILAFGLLSLDILDESGHQFLTHCFDVPVVAIMPSTGRSFHLLSPKWGRTRPVLPCLEGSDVSDVQVVEWSRLLHDVALRLL